MRRLDVPPSPYWQQSIAFSLVVPEQNRYRVYRLTLTQDLFGNWALIRSWGRMGKTQRVQVSCFPRREDARKLADAIVRRRLRHGYGVTNSL